MTEKQPGGGWQSAVMPKCRRRDPQLTIIWKEAVYESTAEREAAAARARQVILEIAGLLGRMMASEHIEEQRKLAVEPLHQRTTW